MKREIITIGENGKVHIPTTPVWMSACEIADLFGVFSGKVNSHIKSIFKDGLLREDEVMQTLLFRDRAVDLYNLEMITCCLFALLLHRQNKCADCTMDNCAVCNLSQGFALSERNKWIFGRGRRI